MIAVQRDSMCVLLICLILVGLGLVMVYSSSSVLAHVRFGDSGFFLKKQSIRVFIGLVLMIAFSRLPLHWWARFSRPIMLVALALLLLVLAWGHGAAQRWLSIPALGGSVAFQPAEFAKLALVLYLADVLVRKRDELHNFRHGFVPRLLVVGCALVLIVLQPDLGTTIALGLIALTMLWVGGMRLYHLVGAGLLAALGVGLSLMNSSYQMRRLVNFIDSERDPVTLRQPAWSMASLLLLPPSSWPDERAPLTSSYSREPLCWRCWSTREPYWRSTVSPSPRTSVYSTRRQPASRGSWHYRPLQKNSCHWSAR